MFQWGLEWKRRIVLHVYCVCTDLLAELDGGHLSGLGRVGLILLKLV